MDNDYQQAVSRDFVAIDVEYANSEQDICQVGIAEVRNLEVVNTWSWLIQPPGNIYEEQYIRTHHVTPEMTASVGDFDVAWQEIQPILLNYTQYWAHNAASTELPVLCKNLKSDYDWLDIHDSRDLYQRPDCEPNKGNTLELCCRALGIKFDEKQHHGAEYDALKCAEIVIAYAKGQQPSWDGLPKSDNELRKQMQTKRILHLGEFADYYAHTPSDEEDVLCELSSTYPGAPMQVIDVHDGGGKIPRRVGDRVDFKRLNTRPDNPINGKTVVLTGESRFDRNSLRDALDAMGAAHPTSISGNTYAVILGTKNVGPNKLVDIEKQEARGHHIFRIVGDADLEDLLYGDGKKFFENV